MQRRRRISMIGAMWCIAAGLSPAALSAQESPPPSEEAPEESPTETTAEPAEEKEELAEEEDGGEEESSDEEKIDELKERLERKYRSLENAGEEPAEGLTASDALTPEQQVDQKFGVSWALEQEKYRQEQENRLAQSRTYWLVEEDADSPQLAWGEPTECLYRDGIDATIHMQCDHINKVCLLAESKVFKPLGGDGGELVPTGQDAARVNYCNTTNDEADLELLRTTGYKLQAALLEAPYGYKRDWRGRIFQRYFDLRSRALISVGHTAFVGDGGALSNSLSVETRSTYEHYSVSRGKRHRFNFLEGEMLIDPLRIHAKAFEYTMSRSGREPLLYITEFFGEPSRHDIYMNVGWGIKLFEFDFRGMDRTIEPVPLDEMTVRVENQKFLDVVQLRLQWEVLQGSALEDYVALQLGGGFGTRLRGEEAAYVYPEIGFKSVWLASPRGLWELSTQGTLRYAVEPTTDTAWLRATAKASAEWVFLSVSDQPISLYVTPQADWLEYRGGVDSLREFRVTSGIRFSLFTPAPLDPASYEGYEQ